MNEMIIVENISKKYSIGETLYCNAFRDKFDVWLNGIFHRGNKTHKVCNDFIWALRDVSFSVKQGEVIGVIGRNGAGKSTLLKILSRITEPTSGRVILKGRVSSLLEVGTGFQPELTGRENIFLNGAILGMSNNEIKSKFDEIVAFADIEKFLDTPVKRYSSGMHIRLAFAVAAHLEPEILLIDEVLAVGDIEFQNKCLGKMENAAKKGRTVLFVSHNMPSLVKLCSKTVWIENGTIKEFDQTRMVVNNFIASTLSTKTAQAVFNEYNESKEAYISSITLKNSNNDITSNFDVSSLIKIEIAFCCKRNFHDFRVDVLVSLGDGTPIFSTTTQDFGEIQKIFSKGDYKCQLTIPHLFLASGEYYISVGINEPSIKNYDLHPFILRFNISGNPFKIPRNLGFLVYPFKWEVIND